MRRPLVLGLALLLAGLPLGGPGRPGAAAAAPKTQKAVADLLWQARLLEDDAYRRIGGSEERLQLLRSAVSVLERALAVDPRHAEARVALGRVLSEAELGEDSLRRSAEELLRARRDDAAGVFDFEISQLLGIVLSRLSRFQQAVQEYDRALLALPAQPGGPARRRSQEATIYGNSAEALMALGNLPGAIRRYSQAEAIETTDQAALHTLGLAVACDRDGQIEKSREALLRSLTTDPAMKLFQSDSVFFVPPGDRHYYEALLAEAFANREGAIASWQQFLRELPHSRYAARARAHLEELRRTPGLSAAELYRADVLIGAPLFPPERQAQVLTRQARGEEDIERAVQRHSLELRQCYARALRREPRLLGELEVALVLDRHGAVALAETLRQSFSPEGGSRDVAESQAARDLVRCAVDTIRRWRFPAAEVEHEELALPFRFEARR